jgi:hypothetical protein
MKKLFCVVVTDPTGYVDLESPLIFHIKCEDSNQADDAVREMLFDEYGYDLEWIDGFEIFAFEVTDLDIIEL